MVFVIASVYMMDYVYLFVYVEPALHPRDEASLIIVDNLFDVLLDSVNQYFIEDFRIDVYQENMERFTNLHVILAQGPC